MDPRLGRHLDAAAPLLAEGDLQTFDDRLHREARRLDVGARQVEDVRERHDGMILVERPAQSRLPPPRMSFSPSRWAGGKSSVRTGYGMMIPSCPKRDCPRFTNSCLASGHSAKAPARRVALDLIDGL